MLNKSIKLLVASVLTVGVYSASFACGDGAENPNCSCPMHQKKDKAQEPSAQSENTESDSNT